MKNTKWRLMLESFYDHTGIARNLEREAERGWMLERMSKWGWTYRRMEPQRLKFAVSYYPKASVFDPDPASERQEFQDFCAHTGWEFVTSFAQMEVYCNRLENPVPIQTDPVLEVESIRRSCKSFQFVYWMQLALCMLYSLLYIPRWWKDPVSLLSSSIALILCLLMGEMLVMDLVELVGYYRWVTRAKKAAERGELLPTPSHARFQRICLYIVLLEGVWMLLDVVLAGQRDGVMIYVLSGGGILALIVTVNAVKEGLRHLKVPAGVNRAVTLTLSVLLPVVMVTGITVYIFHSVRQGTFQVSEQGRWKDQLPLQIEDLIGVKHDYSHRMGSESIFLGRFELQQFGPSIDRDTRGSLNYTVITVKVPSLYELCRNHLLEDDRADRWELFGADWAETDPAPWGAQTVWELIDLEDDYSWNRFIVCYPERIIELELGWSPTPEQMALVGERLGGI